MPPGGHRAARERERVLLVGRLEGAEQHVPLVHLHMHTSEALAGGLEEAFSQRYPLYGEGEG